MTTVTRPHHHIAADVGDLKGERQHVELIHDAEDVAGVHQRPLDQL